MGVGTVGLIKNEVLRAASASKGQSCRHHKVTFDKKADADSENEKCKCRFVDTAFEQIQRLHGQEELAPEPAAASMRMVLLTTTEDS